MGSFHLEASCVKKRPRACWRTLSAGALTDSWRTDWQVAYHSGDIPGIDGNFSNPPVKVKENLGSVMDAITDRFHLDPKH